MHVGHSGLRRRPARELADRAHLHRQRPAAPTARRPSPPARLGVAWILVCLVACTGSGSLDSPPPAPTPDPRFCGDGVVDPGEICDDGVNDALDGGCLPGCEEEDLYQEVFERELLVIDLEIDPDDWDELRTQRKTRHSVFGTTDCRSAPVVNPYTWFPVSVTIDGETMPGAGIRKKGHFGSQSTTRPSLKLKFDEFDGEGRFHTMKRLALNNSKSDGSYTRTCAAYTTFEGAGAPAPACTHARVNLNGEPLGVFVVTEELKKPFLRRRFPDATGTLYEGTACDWRPEFVGGFEQETNEDVDTSRADLMAVYEVIQNSPDDALEADLAQLIDLDDFYRFWATEVIVWHRDGYSGNANNYLLYGDPEDQGRIQFVPWGTDGTFRSENQGAVLAYGVLTNRLYATPSGRLRYAEAMDAVLEEVWDEEGLVAESDRIADLVRPFLSDDEVVLLDEETAAIQAAILSRRAGIAAATALGYADWLAGLRFNPCRTPLESITGTFETTWGTLSGNFYDSGSSTLTLDGAALELTRAGARAGALGDGRPRVQLRLETDELRYTFTFTFPASPWFEDYAVVGDHDLGTPPVGTAVTIEDITTDPAVALGTFDATEGVWTFEQIDRSAGGAVVGSFDGTLWARP